MKGCIILICVIINICKIWAIRVINYFYRSTDVKFIPATELWQNCFIFWWTCFVQNFSYAICSQQCNSSKYVSTLGKRTLFSKTYCLTQDVKQKNVDAQHQVSAEDLQDVNITDIPNSTHTHIHTKCCWIVSAFKAICECDSYSCRLDHK